MKQGTFLKSQFAGPIYDPQTQQPFSTVTTDQGDACRFLLSASTPSLRTWWRGETIWPTATSQSSTSNNYSANTTEPDNNHQFDLKGDYQFRNGDRVFLRESYQRRDLSAPSPGTRFVQIGDVNAKSRNHNAAVGYDHTFSTTAVNELRLGLTALTHRISETTWGPTRTQHWHSQRNDMTHGATGMGNFQIGNIVNTGSQDGPTRTASATPFRSPITSPRHGDATPLSWAKTIATCWPRSPIPTATRTEIFPSPPTTQVAARCSPRALATQAAMSSPASCWAFRRIPIALRGDESGNVGEDAWCVCTGPIPRHQQSHFQRCAALDLITPATDRHNSQSNFDLDQGVLIFATSGNRGPNVDTYFGGYSPRVGFAYSPNNGRTSVSGAFGITPLSR